MTAHQAKGMHQSVGPQTSLGEGPDEVVQVHIVEENVIALVATAHQVIHGPGILHSHFARHDIKRPDEANQNAKPKSKTYWLSPSTGKPPRKISGCIFM
jgi:hypothetical protein